jgi:hypothetical protein
MYNAWQTLSYTAKYGSPKPKVKHTHYVVMYGDRILTKPMYYSGCQVELKQFKMQGVLYPDKSKFKIVGV